MSHDIDFGSMVPYCWVGGPLEDLQEFPPGLDGEKSQSTGHIR